MQSACRVAQITWEAGRVSRADPVWSCSNLLELHDGAVVGQFNAGPINWAGFNASTASSTLHGYCSGMCGMPLLLYAASPFQHLNQASRRVLACFAMRWSSFNWLMTRLWQLGSGGWIGRK